jgi:hypothetical protein
MWIKQKQLTTNWRTLMKARRILIAVAALGLLLFVAFPHPASADITGNTYSFSAVWFYQKYQVDSSMVMEQTQKGDFQIAVTNITPSDAYEYTYSGMNYHPYGSSPYYDEDNDTVAFQSNKVYFDLTTVDSDDNGLAESYSLLMSPSFAEHHPGNMFFVNPVWSTHTTDWNEAVDTANGQPAVTALTESASGGSFSFDMTVGVEYDHSVYGYMNGTAEFKFSASYNSDGVLSTWSLQQIISTHNENHTILTTIVQSYAQGAAAGIPEDTSLSTTLMIVGLTGVGGLIVGLIIGKKYWG